ncbi:Bud-site selection protein [Scleroderma yunnanense]
MSDIGQDDDDSRLRRKLHHDVKEIRQVTKKAKIFEIRRTFKKLKKARHDDPQGAGTKDLEEQMEILKDMDCNKIANTVLMTKIKKDKALSEDPHIHPFVSAELASNSLVPAPSGTATAKAQSRILSSKLLASEVIATVAALKDFLHPDSGTGGIAERQNRSAVPKIGKKSRTESDRVRDPALVNNDSNEGYPIGSDRHILSEIDDGGWESGTVGDNQPSAMSDGWESGSVQGSSYRGETASDVVSDVGGPSDVEIKAKKATLLSQSAFLPTLSVGFTRGDSDSEFTDSEAKIADSTKKNRRGQRARRAIWEKKYGKNANHVKKRREIAQGEKRKGPGPASKGQQRSKSHGQEQRKHSRDPPLKRVEKTSTGRGMHTRGSSSNGRRTDEERPLHPSWEAKKKQQAASIVLPQGTKIIFDS